MKKITIENTAYKWFDMKLSTYDKLEIDGSIYLYYDGDEYADIRIDKKFKDIHYISNLYMEFSEVIQLYYYEFENIMSKWVEYTFGLKGFTPGLTDRVLSDQLKIPK